MLVVAERRADAEVGAAADGVDQLGRAAAADRAIRVQGQDIAQRHGAPRQSASRNATPLSLRSSRSCRNSALSFSSAALSMKPPSGRRT